MASLRVRTRRRSPNANAPLSLTFTSNASKDPFAPQAAQWNTQLKLATDLQQMQKLADGHTDQFIEFAKARIDDKDLTPEQRAYWKGWLGDAKRKVTEETLAAEIGSGDKKLEDLAAYTRTRLTEVGTGSSDYPQLVKQLSSVKNAILARDFNSEVSQAQQRLIDTGSRQRYLEDLQTISSRTRSTEAATALAEQMSTLRVEIAKEKTTARSAQANKKLLQYYQGEIGRGEILDYLEDMAASSGSTAEAQHYTTVGTQIDTRERQIERQALSDAASGNTKALRAAISGYEESYKGVDSGLVVALRTAKSDRGGLERTYNRFEVEAKDYEDALLEALPMAQTIASRKEVTNALNALRNNIAERQKQVSHAVTDNILENARDLIKEAAATSDPDLSSQFRHLAVTTLSDGLKDELAALNGDQIERLENLHKTATDAHKAAIAKEAKILTGVEHKGRDAAASAFNAYQDHYRRLAASYAAKKDGATPTPGPMADFAKFQNALNSGDLTLLGLSPKRAESASMVAGWTSNISQANDEQKRITTGAGNRLKTLVAPRDPNGKVIGFGRGSSAAPIEGSPEETVFGAPPALPLQSTADMEPELPTMPLSTSASKGPGMLTIERPDDEPDDPYSAAERTAFAYLMQPTEFEFPSYELPPLPEMPDFAPNDDDYLDGMASAPIKLRPSLRTHAEGSIVEAITSRSMSGSPAAAGTDIQIAS